MGLTGRGGEGARPLQSTQRRVLSFRDASKRISKRHLSIADALEAAKAQGAKSEAGLVIEHMPLGPDPIPNTQVSDPLAANRDDVAASSPVDPEADERQRDILGLRSVFANLMLYVDAKDSSWFGDVLRWIKHRIFGYGLSRAKVRVAEQVTSQYAADFCAAGEGAENIITSGSDGLSGLLDQLRNQHEQVVLKSLQRRSSFKAVLAKVFLLNTAFSELAFSELNDGQQSNQRDDHVERMLPLWNQLLSQVKKQSGRMLGVIVGVNDDPENDEERTSNEDKLDQGATRMLINLFRGGSPWSEQAGSLEVEEAVYVKGLLVPAIASFDWCQSFRDGIEIAEASALEHRTTGNSTRVEDASAAQLKEALKASIGKQYALLWSHLTRPKDDAGLLETVDEVVASVGASVLGS